MKDSGIVTLRSRAQRAALAACVWPLLLGGGSAALGQDVRQDWAGVTDVASPAMIVGDNPRAVGADLDGNVYTTGRVVTGPGNSSIAVWRHDGSGNLHPNYPVLWPPIGSGIQGEFVGVCLAVQTRSKFENEHGNPTPLPRIAVAGYGPAQAGTGRDFVVLHLEANGQFVWFPMQPATLHPSYPMTGVYNNPVHSLDDVPVAIAVGFYDDIYVTGNSATNQKGRDVSTIRIARNSGGAIVDAARYNGLGNMDDFATDIALKYSGETLWVQDGGTGGQSPIPQPAESAVFVVGSTITSTARGEDFLVMGYPANLSNPFDPGHPNWVQTYYNPLDPNDPLSPPAVAKGRDVATSVSISENFGVSDRRVWVTGLSAGVGTGIDYATLCYTFEGLPAWPGAASNVVRYNDATVNGPDIPAKIVAGAEHAGKLIYVTGRSLNAAGDFDIFTIAYRSGFAGAGGSVEWSHRYDRGHGDDEPMGMALGGTEGLYITATSANGFGADMHTIRYNRFSGANPLDGLPFWNISFPQVPDGEKHFPMGLTVAPNPSHSDLPFIITAGRVPGLMLGAPQRLGTVQYEQCPGNCPP